MKLTDRLMARFATSQKRVRAAAVIGIAGMVLIGFSELMPESRDKEESSVQAAAIGDETEEFRMKTAAELKKLLARMEGVGECSVMVSVEGTEEYIYAENVDRSSDSGTDRKSEAYRGEVVLTEQEGGRQALVKRVLKPKISGVLVVCSGGGDLRVSERVMRAVSTALGISSSKVCVEEKQK